MKKSLVFSQILVLLVLSLSCQDGPTSISSRPPDIGHLKNIPFTLTEIKTGPSVVNLDEYEPFHFLIADSNFFGDNTCNDFFGDFTLEGGYFNVTGVWRTALGCGEGSKYELVPCFLAGRWNFQSISNVIVLRSGDTSVTFESKWMKSLADLTCTDKKWKLSYSTGTEYDYLNSVGMVLTLSLTTERTYELRWFIPPDKASNSINSREGIFGIADINLIYFYGGGGGYSTSAHPGVGSRDLFFVNGITRSTCYSCSPRSLSIWNPSTGTHFLFRLDQG